MRGLTYQQLAAQNALLIERLRVTNDDLAFTLARLRHLEQPWYRRVLLWFKRKGS